MIGNILSPTHLLLVLAVALLVLGPKRLPEVGRGLGSAIRDFKGSLSGTDLTDERPALESLNEPDRAPLLLRPTRPPRRGPRTPVRDRPTTESAAAASAADREPVTLRRDRP